MLLLLLWSGSSLAALPLVLSRSTCTCSTSTDKSGAWCTMRGDASVHGRVIDDHLHFAITCCDSCEPRVLCPLPQQRCMQGRRTLPQRRCSGRCVESRVPAGRCELANTQASYFSAQATPTYRHVVATVVQCRGICLHQARAIVQRRADAVPCRVVVVCLVPD